MFSQILANMRTNFKFYKRNRLLLAISVLVVLVMVLSTLPSLFYLTKTRHLELIRMLLNQLSTYAMFISAAIGLLMVSHHMRNRSLKMVFTKPCLPEVWLLSGFISAIIVALALYVLIFLISSILFFVWDVPYQWGVAYIVLNEFLKTVIILSYISFLGVIMHPVVVVLFLILFGESTFYFLKTLLASGIEKTQGLTASLLKLLKLASDGIYMIIPTTSPYVEMKSQVYGSLRFSDANWKYMLYTLCYAIAVTVLFYLLSTYFIKRKRLI
jgi:ABC-type transport system involved in multi-copper enzyme maturation permease subunit